MPRSAPILRATAIAVLALLVGCSDDVAGVDDASAGVAGGGTAGSSGAGAATGGGGMGGSASTAGANARAGNGGVGGGDGGVAGGAGTGGMAEGGMSGGAGVGGAGGSGTASASAGCGFAAGQALGSWVEQPKLNVNGKERQWWVWLPTGYDPSRAYRLVFTFHGCGGPDNIVPMQKVAGDAAILVRGTGITGDGCWTYGGDGDDVKFFDAMLAKLNGTRCIDTARVFATGYSSGGWLVNTLGCVRGDKLRATGSVSGGVVGNRGTCVGKFARIFVHDQDDTTNKFVENGNQAERGRVLEQNHCMAQTPPVPEAPAPCARYQGCDAGYPVVMCQTQGKQHDRQDGLAPGAFWGFFSKL